MTTKVDVAMCSYGKPFQTAVTLASLLKQSGHHIGRIFIQEEREQPYDETVDYVRRCFPAVDIVQYIPKMFLGTNDYDAERLWTDEAYRLSVRYQLAWERSNEDFLFVTHNDCLFTADVIGDMLSHIGDEFAGVGLVGQCWNCPARSADLCDGDRHEIYNPTYEEVEELIKAYPGPRLSIDWIDRAQPMPFMECRLGEFACLINLAMIRADVCPIGPVVPFGAFYFDTGSVWFRQLRGLGKRFLNRSWGFEHAPFSPNGNGHSALSDRSLYDAGEEGARAFLLAHYPNLFDSVSVLRGVTRTLKGLPC